MINVGALLMLLALKKYHTQKDYNNDNHNKYETEENIT